MDWISALPFISRLWNWYRSLLGLNRIHDVAVFKKLDAIANESRVEDILHHRIFTSQLRPQDEQTLVDLRDAISRIENHYLDSTVQLRADELGWEIGRLLSLIGKTFWSVPQGWKKFRPDPIDPQVYDAEWRELIELIDSTWRAYEAYRKAVKERLKV